MKKRRPRRSVISNPHFYNLNYKNDPQQLMKICKGKEAKKGLDGGVQKHNQKVPSKGHVKEFKKPKVWRRGVPIAEQKI